NTYTTSALATGDLITCEMNSSLTCVASSIAISGTINMTVNPMVTPSVSIVDSPGYPLCAKKQIRFTASISNGGPAPLRQWKVNGVIVGGNNNVYTSTLLATGDTVSCVLISNAACKTKGGDTSNAIIMT